MRFLFIALLALIQHPPLDQTGTIEGTVMRFGGLGPIAGAKIKITSAAANPQDSVPVSEAAADGAGRFVVSGIPAGSYFVEVSADGYLFGTAPIGVNPTFRANIAVVAGQQTRVLFSGAAASTLRGRILDSDGGGVRDLPVFILRKATDDQGRRMWTGVWGAPPRTNDEGEYERPMLGPGEYFVRVTLEPPDALPVSIYYPETVDSAAAAPVILAEGAEGIADIRIGSALNAPTYSISGSVTHPLLQASNSSVGLILRERLGESGLTSRGSMDLSLESPYRFEVKGIRAGTYDLYASANMEGKEYLAKAMVEVRDRNVENLSLPLQPGIDIKGRLVSDGDVQDLQLSRTSNRGPVGNVGIVLRRKDGLFDTSLIPPMIENDGTSFSFGEVPVGDYEFTVSFVADGRTPNPDWYVSDIRASGRSVYDTGFQVGADPVDSMEIVVGTNGGVIEGTIPDMRAPRSAVLILVPDTFRRGNVYLYRVRVIPANPNGNNTFQLRGLAPGNYKIFAVPTPNGSMLPYRSAEFLAQHDARAPNITIRKGTTTGGVQVPLLPTSP